MHKFIRTTGHVGVESNSRFFFHGGSINYAKLVTGGCCYCRSLLPCFPSFFLFFFFLRVTFFLVLLYWPPRFHDGIIMIGEIMPLSLSSRPNFVSVYGTCRAVEQVFPIGSVLLFTLLGDVVGRVCIVSVLWITVFFSFCSNTKKETRNLFFIIIMYQQLC